MRRNESYVDVNLFLQKRFPDLNITEEDLKNAEKDLDDLLKEDDKENKIQSEEPKTVEDKKSI